MEDDMADDQPPDPPPSQVFIAGIDLSAHVKDFQITHDPAMNDLPFGGGFNSLKPMEPITITGHWVDYNSVTCGNCGQPFVPGPEGTPVLTDTESGMSVTICPDCVVAILVVNQEG